MQKYPVEGACAQSDVKFVIVEEGFVKMLKNRMINVVFPKCEKYAPGDHRGQYIEKQIEEDDLFLVRHRGLVTGEVDNFYIVEIEVYGVAVIAASRELYPVSDGIC